MPVPKSYQPDCHNRQGSDGWGAVEATRDLGWQEKSRCRTTAWVTRVTAYAHVCCDKGWWGSGGGGVTLFSDRGLLFQLTHWGRPGQLGQLPHF